MNRMNLVYCVTEHLMRKILGWASEKPALFENDLRDVRDLSEGAIKRRKTSYL